MFKKLLAAALTITASLAVCASAFAADVYQTIRITEGQYPNISFYPRTIYINQGDSLHLTLINTRQGYTRIFVPAFNLDQEMPKARVAQLDFCTANPISKTCGLKFILLAVKKFPDLLL